MIKQSHNSIIQFARFLVQPILPLLSWPVFNWTKWQNNSCDPNCRVYPRYINEGSIDKSLLPIFFWRDLVEPNAEIYFNSQGRYPGGDGGSEDLQDEGSDADDEKVGVRDLI